MTRADRVGQHRSAAIVQTLDESFAAGLVPPRDPRGHKGTFGTLLVVAGSLEYAGAALLAGTAALRAGAGLVILCLPASLAPLLAGRVPELVTLPLPEREPGAVDAPAAAQIILERPHQALLVGPGLRPNRPSGSLVEHLVARPAEGSAAPVVIDAEALNQLARRPRWWQRIDRPAVLTPHPGEFARLHGIRPSGSDRDRLAAAAEAAVLWSQVVVLKGAHTVVSAPGPQQALAPFAQPALATGGSGDVLAGVIGSLLAQGVAPFEAACLGVWLHGSAGDRVAARLGDAGVLPSDLLIEIPLVRRRLAGFGGAPGAVRSGSTRGRAGTA